MRSSHVCLALVFAANPALARARPRGQPALQSSATSVLYYGGPVIANPKVYVLWWGGGAALPASITSEPGGVGSFFEGVLDSPFVDAWAQYDTAIDAQAGSKEGSPGTSQNIGRGNYAGAYALTSVPAGPVTDAQIQSALEGAISAGAVPPNDANTIYAIYFPAAVSVSVDGSSSCTLSGFGGYHDQTTSLGAAYLVIPDCNYGFIDFCSVSSHELAEATTDLRPTPGSDPDYPQAWNDDMGNEIADLCEGTGALLATGSGSFAVQGIWDQRSSSCQVAAQAVRDFSVAIAPHAWSLASGASTSLAVQTETVAGSAQALALSASAPAGVTATLADTSVISGASTTLTISAASPLRDGQVVITAASSAGGTVWIHTASLLLNVADATDDFALSLSPAQAQATAGETATFTVQTQVDAGNVPEIALTTSGLPTSIGASFSPASVAPGASSTLSLTTPRALAGTFSFEVLGTTDVTRSATALLELVAPVVPDAGPATPDAGTAADGGASSSTQAPSSGCAETPASAWALALAACLISRAHRRRRLKTGFH